MKKKFYLVSFLAVICFLALFISEPALLLPLIKGMLPSAPIMLTAPITVN